MSQPLFSPCGWGVSAVENTLTIQKDNNLAIKFGKVITRSVADLALTIVSLIELVVFVILSVISLPTLFFTGVIFEYFKDHTIIALNVTCDALKGIMGCNTKKIAKKVVKKPVKPNTTPPPLKKQGVKERIKEYAVKIFREKTVTAFIAFAATITTANIFGIYNTTLGLVVGAAVYSSHSDLWHQKTEEQHCATA